MRILIVDDDEDVRETLRLVLEAKGHELHFAEDGEQCLARLKEGFRGLILLDIMMPRLNGWETIEKMVELGLVQGNVICMMTAVLDPGRTGEHVASHVLHYLRKPFLEKELQSVISQYGSFCGGETE